ncbi:MAG: hypothetical protein P8N16_02210, partial [Amylibacter sp.]|nr:hypothetical protein [Amylibacter sp.]
CRSSGLNSPWHHGRPKTALYPHSKEDDLTTTATQGGDMLRITAEEHPNLAKLLDTLLAREEPTTDWGLLSSPEGYYLLSDVIFQSPHAFDMGYVAADGITHYLNDEEIDDLLFNASEVGIYGPIDTNLGPALFQINAIIDPQNTSFADAAEELTAEYVSIESRKLINEMITDIDDLLAQGLTLEEIAKETAMELEKISYDNTTENGIAAYDGFRDEALKVKIGGFPELRELSDGGVFALRLDDLIEPALRPFETVKDQVATDWSASEDKKSLLKLADTLIIKLDNGETFESLNLNAESVSSITRNKYIEGIPAQLLEELFSNKTGKTSKIDNGDNVLLARLNDISEFNSETDESKELLSQVGIQLSNQVTGDLLRLFASALKDRDGVILNQNAVNQINTQILGGTGF